VPAYAAPARRDDLSGLPATWLYAGDIELFHDEIVEYAGRLRAAGVDTALTIVPGAAHGFENWAATTPLAESLLAEARTWLGEALRR
jgi:acetyl esterase/lipase